MVVSNKKSPIDIFNMPVFSPPRRRASMNRNSGNLETLPEHRAVKNFADINPLSSSEHTACMPSESSEQPPPQKIQRTIVDQLEDELPLMRSKSIVQASPLTMPSRKPTVEECMMTELNLHDAHMEELPPPANSNGEVLIIHPPTVPQLLSGGTVPASSSSSTTAMNNASRKTKVASASDEKVMNNKNFRPMPDLIDHNVRGKAFTLPIDLDRPKFLGEGGYGYVVRCRVLRNGHKYGFNSSYEEDIKNVDIKKITQSKAQKLKEMSQQASEDTEEKSSADAANNIVSDAHPVYNVAVKRVQLPSSPSYWEENVRLLREVHFLLKVPHPNITSCLDIYLNREAVLRQDASLVNSFYTVMPLFSPGALDDIEGGITDENEFCTIVRDMVQGVLHLHRHNIIHRDIKRENIFFDRRKKRAAIADLGMARTLCTVLKKFHPTGESVDQKKTTAKNKSVKTMLRPSRKRNSRYFVRKNQQDAQVEKMANHMTGGKYVSTRPYLAPELLDMSQRADGKGSQGARLPPAERKRISDILKEGDTMLDFKSSIRRDLFNANSDRRPSSDYELALDNPALLFKKQGALSRAFPFLASKGNGTAVGAANGEVKVVSISNGINNKEEQLNNNLQPTKSVQSPLLDPKVPASSSAGAEQPVSPKRTNPFSTYENKSPRQTTTFQTPRGTGSIVNRPVGSTKEADVEDESDHFYESDEDEEIIGETNRNFYYENSDYTFAVDVWALGCVIYELIVFGQNNFVLFPESVTIVTHMARQFAINRQEMSKLGFTKKRNPLFYGTHNLVERAEKEGTWAKKRWKMFKQKLNDCCKVRKWNTESKEFYDDLVRGCLRYKVPTRYTIEDVADKLENAKWFMEKTEPMSEMKSDNMKILRPKKKQYSVANEKFQEQLENLNSDRERQVAIRKMIFELILHDDTRLAYKPPGATPARRKKKQNNKVDTASVARKESKKTIIVKRTESADKKEKM